MGIAAPIRISRVRDQSTPTIYVPYHVYEIEENLVVKTATPAAVIGPAIKRAYASGKPGVIHIPIDPKVNSEEMPSYDEFRTWYAEGTQ